VSHAAISTVDVLTTKVFIGLIVGAMLPCWFSAMTIRSVVSTALKMVEEVRRQFNIIPGLMEGTGKPNYATCVKISTDASVKEMIPPGALVMLNPLIVGILFGVENLSDVLAGALVSGVKGLYLSVMHAFYIDNDRIPGLVNFDFLHLFLLVSMSGCYFCIQHWWCSG
jgi:H+-translocating diphosphatase